MTQAYSNPEREEDKYSLPDVEIFYMSQDDIDMESFSDAVPGWYWWSCFPGCLPDGDPVGPFDTEEEALQDAQDVDDFIPDDGFSDGGEPYTQKELDIINKQDDDEHKRRGYTD
jgi:hypothetical protein